MRSTHGMLAVCWLYTDTLHSTLTWLHFRHRLYHYILDMFHYVLNEYTSSSWLVASDCLFKRSLQLSLFANEHGGRSFVLYINLNKERVALTECWSIKGVRRSKLMYVLAATRPSQQRIGQNIQMSLCL